MFGECHAHVIMDGINYKAAVALHKDGVCEAAVRAHLKEWKDAGITVKVKSFAPRQIQRRSFAALAITLSRKIF